jgi:hypothetical protein
MQIPVTGALCAILWVILDGNAPYWRTHHFLMGHIKFWRNGAMPKPWLNEHKSTAAMNYSEITLGRAIAPKFYMPH